MTLVVHIPAATCKLSRDLKLQVEVLPAAKWADNLAPCLGPSLIDGIVHSLSHSVSPIQKYMEATLNSETHVCTHARFRVLVFTLQ